RQHAKRARGLSTQNETAAQDQSDPRYLHPSSSVSFPTIVARADRRIDRRKCAIADVRNLRNSKGRALQPIECGCRIRLVEALKLVGIAIENFHVAVAGAGTDCKAD